MANDASSAMVASSMAKPARRSWGGSAFILESLLLIVFFIASFAIILQLLSVSYVKGAEASELTTAVSLATKEAEQFAEDPTAEPFPKQYASSSSGEAKDREDVSSEEMYIVKRNVTYDESDAGILYRAHITVERNSKEVYALDTAKYVADDYGRISSVASSRARSSSSSSSTMSSEGVQR